MEFVFTEEQAMIAVTANQFFTENASSERTRKAMASDGFDRDLWQSFCQELGLAGVNIPEDFGGSGLGLLEFATLAEAAGSQVAAIPMLGLIMASRAIAAGGSDAQKSAWLEKLASGKVIAAYADGVDVTVQGGVLSGTTALCPHAHIADIILISYDGGTGIVSANASGVGIETFTSMDQTRPLSRFTFNNVSAERLPDSKAAKKAAQEGGYICLAAEALGGAQATLDRTVAYANERVQFGRLIGSFQAYKHRLADMMIEIEQGRSAVYWAACAVDEGSNEAPLALHAAKSFCADTYFKCAGDMIQLHGGIGFTWEHDAHLFFKRARSIQTLLSDGNCHREEIANIILGDAA